MVLQLPVLPSKPLWMGGSLAPNIWWIMRFTLPVIQDSSSWAPAHGYARPTAAGQARRPAVQVLLIACPGMSFGKVDLYKHRGILGCSKWGGISATPQSSGMLQLPWFWDFSVLRKTVNYSWSTSAGEMRGNGTLAMTCRRVPKHPGVCSIPEPCFLKGDNMERGYFSRRDQRVLKQPLPEWRDMPGGSQPLQMPLPAAVDWNHLPVPGSDW